MVSLRDSSPRTGAQVKEVWRPNLKALVEE